MENTMPNKKIKAVVIHSGGMDSSICLALARREFGKEHVLSLSFAYHQRHAVELVQAAKICREWDVEHKILQIDILKETTVNALLDHHIGIEARSDQAPNTLVLGRNGLMARLGTIYAHGLNCNIIYMGIIGVEGSNSGYRDCSREYIDLKQKILRMDLNDPLFQIRTPLIDMTKKETMQLAYQLGVLPFLLQETITCYEGLPKQGCQVCPACHLRNEGLRQFMEEHPEVFL